MVVPILAADSTDLCVHVLVDVQVYVPGFILDRLCQVHDRVIDREREHIARIPERLHDLKELHDHRNIEPCRNKHPGVCEDLAGGSVCNNGLLEDDDPVCKLRDRVYVVCDDNEGFSLVFQRLWLNPRRRYSIIWQAYFLQEQRYRTAFMKKGSDGCWTRFITMSYQGGSENT